MIDYFYWENLLIIKTKYKELYSIFNNNRDKDLKKITLTKNGCFLFYKIENQKQTKNFKEKHLISDLKIWDILLGSFIINHFRKKIRFSTYDYPFNNSIAYSEYTISSINFDRKNEWTISFPLKDLVLGLMFAFFIKREVEFELDEEIDMVCKNNTSISIEKSLELSLLKTISQVFMLTEINLNQKIEVKLISKTDLKNLNGLIFFFNEKNKPENFWLNNILKNDKYKTTTIF